MNTERNPDEGWVPLPGFAESAAGEQAPAPGDAASAGHTGSARIVGIRHVRRMSNWTAAALIVGAGATTVALAHHTFPTAAPAAGAASTATGAGTAAAAQGAGPQVSHTVATTSASGVTTTTTTKVVNGKTVVSQVRNAPAYHDN